MGRIDSLAIECGLIRQDLDKFRGRVSAAGSCISEIEVDAGTSNMRHEHELQHTVKLLIAHSEDMENLLRRNNGRVVGLPEGSEGSSPTGFAEMFFKDILKLNQVSLAYIVEQAHRVLMGPRPQRAPPGPFSVRFLNYWDRDFILAEARKQPQLRYKNITLHFFPDFSPELFCGGEEVVA